MHRIFWNVQKFTLSWSASYFKNEYIILIYTTYNPINPNWSQLNHIIPADPRLGVGFKIGIKRVAHCSPPHNGAAYLWKYNRILQENPVWKLCRCISLIQGKTVRVNTRRFLGVSDSYNPPTSKKQFSGFYQTWAKGTHVTCQITDRVTRMSYSCPTEE